MSLLKKVLSNLPYIYLIGIILFVSIFVSQYSLFETIWGIAVAALVVFAMIKRKVFLSAFISLFFGLIFLWFAILVFLPFLKGIGASSPEDLEDFYFFLIVFSFSFTGVVCCLLIFLQAVIPYRRQLKLEKKAQLGEEHIS